MTAAVDWLGLSSFVGSLSALVGAVTSIVVVLRQQTVARTVNRVHEEVKTINSLTLAQMAEADESRRISSIPERDRSLVEREHLSVVPILGQDDHAPPIPETSATGTTQPNPEEPMPDPKPAPAAPTIAQATSPLGAEPVVIPVWAAGFVGVALALGVDLLSDVDLRDALVSALVTLAPVLGVGVPVARRRAWSARSVRRKLDAG